jgi:hypothetical protein
VLNFDPMLPAIMTARSSAKKCEDAYDNKVGARISPWGPPLLMRSQSDL